MKKLLKPLFTALFAGMVCTGAKAADGGTDVAKETGVDESAPVKVAEAGGLY